MSLAHEMTVPIDEDHRQRVVRQHRLDNGRDARKHRADVEDVGNGTEQFDGALDLGRALPLDSCMTRLVGEPLMGHPESEVIGEPLRVKQVARRISLRIPRQQSQGAC